MKSEGSYMKISKKNPDELLVTRTKPFPDWKAPGIPTYLITNLPIDEEILDRIMAKEDS